MVPTQTDENCRGCITKLTDLQSQNLLNWLTSIIGVSLSKGKLIWNHCVLEVKVQGSLIWHHHVLEVTHEGAHKQ